MIFIKHFKKYLFISFVCLFFSVHSLSASTLTFESKNLKYGKNETFAVDIRISDVDNCVNVVGAKILFNQNDLQIEEFLVGNSILSFWVNQPDKDTIGIANQMGFLTFAGGAPGGYCGKIAGDPGDSNAIGRIIFKVTDIGLDRETQVGFDDVSVLLNDGLGTMDAVNPMNLKLQLIANESGNNEDIKGEILSDKINPEPFVVELHRDSEVFNNQYYIVFSSIDKQTGIDRYEVLEIRSGEVVGDAPKMNLLDRLTKQKRERVDWMLANTPQLLRDQTLQSVIRVKAIDKAGNEREVSFIPPESEKQKIKNSFFNSLFVILLTVGAIIILIILITYIFKKSHAKNNKEGQAK